MKRALDLQINAVSLHGASLSFDCKEESVSVLDKFDMTVPRGAIYGLLGASGCGKTSLLQCIAGVRKLKTGQIFVLGHPPGSPGSGVPGPSIGFMPQELAIMTDLSTKNVLFYFGRIFGMTSDVIEERLAYFSSLLQLQDLHLCIEQLSGGQQRRVSLAAAMFHDPEMLILDEPTVGLDPLLTQRIWDYLKEMTRQSGTTVLLTTHYIEEARQADVVGLMRQGKLLAENSPPTLMRRHRCDSLELIFLKLAQAQRNHTLPPLEPYTCIADVIHNQTQQQANLPRTKTNFSFWSRMHALLLRNMLGFISDKSCMASIFLLTLLNLGLCLIAIGHIAQHVPLAVVNDELPRQSLFKLVSGDTSQQHAFLCKSSHLLSCEYIDIIKSNFSLHYYSNVASAEAAARAGHVRGVLHFGKDFSTALQRRFQQNLLQVSDVTIDQSQISVRLDMTDYNTGLAIKYILLNAFTSLPKRIFNINTDNPMRVQNLYFHEERVLNYSFFTAVGSMLVVIYFLNLANSFQYILRDFYDGTWARNKNLGVSVGEVLTCHVVSQFILVLLQTAEAIGVLYLAGLVNQGSLTLFVAITALCGLFGISAGVLVSSISQDYMLATYLSAGSFFLSLLSCGISWPVEGIPRLLRVVCEHLPLTSMIATLTNILSKGLGLSSPKVYLGLFSSLGWSASCLVIAYVLHKARE